MKIFKDKELKEEIASLDLGIVTAGGRKEYEFFVLNDSRAHLKNITFEVSHVEVKVVAAPETLKEKEIGSLILAWSPSTTLKEGLKTVLRIQASELWS